MRVGIRSQQILGVTAIVGFAVVALSALHVARLGRVILHESQARGQLLSNAVFHRAREVVTGSGDPYAALRDDPGLRAILESSIYGESVTDAAILDAAGVIIADSDQTREGTRRPGRADLAPLVARERGAFGQLRVIYSGDGQTLDVSQPLMLGDQAFGSIHIGISTLLMRQELNASLRPALLTAALALVVAVFVAALLARLVLRPIHVLRSGLTRLGKGEFGVTLDLPPGDEFGDLGTFFNSVSQQLEDREKAGDPEARLEATLAFSRKLVALNRLTAGIAHEVKNPLNAMMIHLELLRTKLRATALEPVTAGGTAVATRGGGMDPLQHVEVIESEIRRLDEVVQGFLKFTRPEDLHLQPVRVSALFDDVRPVVDAEARKNGVTVVVECPPGLAGISGDARLLHQALLNLAINACQAMPKGGTLRLAAANASHARVAITVEDSGVGITPEHLGKIFDLYFTTKEHGTGLGLSMVYRIIQLHGGEVEVESTPGRGTIFRALLPRASEA